MIFLVKLVKDLCDHISNSLIVTECLIPFLSFEGQCKRPLEFIRIYYIEKSSIQVLVRHFSYSHIFFFLQDGSQDFSDTYHKFRVP